ncbi:MAG TPA: M56 family metallopeptidase [Novosphingobium sp.]|nr:M56 family metallopeptidase [Novosphingobium sp.]
MSWLLDTFVMTGALIALVLVLRRPVARAFGPGMAYALWLLPMLRLVLPPLVLPASLAPTPDAAQGEVLVASFAQAAAPAMPATEPSLWTLSNVTMILWLGGALVFLGWRIAGYIAMRRRLLAGARPVGEAGRIRLVETPATPAPVAFGVLDKVVALPPGFMNRTDIAGRDLAIAHELQHHAAHDLAVNIAVQPLLALHWCNPLAWAGWRALRRDQEAACDARVLAGRDATTRAAYGRLIASFAQSPRLALAAPMAGQWLSGPVIGEKSIIHRLRSLTMNEVNPRRRLLGRVLIGAGALALPLTASISYAAQDAPEAPTPPSAPEAPTAPDAPKVERHITIIEHRDGHGDHARTIDESKLHTRTVTRDGKTIIIKTDHEISDADLEERLANLDDLVPPVPPVPPVPGVAPIAPEAPQRIERRMVIRHGEGHGPGEIRIMSDGGREVTCAPGREAADVDTSGEGTAQRVRIRLCHAAAAKVSALEGIRRARASIAANPELSARIKADVLRELDDEIRDLSEAD